MSYYHKEEDKIKSNIIIIYRGIKMAVRKLNNYLNVIGSNLKYFRKERHLSQADLIKDLNLLGINMHKNDIYMIEKNKRTVKDYELWGFIKILNVSFEDLIKGIENKRE